MKRILILASIAVLYVAPAFAAGPYDGSWTGEADALVTGGSRGGGAACTGVVTATIKDNKVQGQIQYGHVTSGFGGTISPDGSFTGRAGPNPTTGKFSGNSYAGTYTANGNCQNYRMSLKRS